MENTKMHIRMVFAIVSERTGDGLRSDQAEVVKIIGPRGVGEIGVEDTPAELGAVASDTGEVVLVGARIELRHAAAILLARSPNNENIDAAREGGSHHSPPLRFVA